MHRESCVMLYDPMDHQKSKSKQQLTIPTSMSSLVVMSKEQRVRPDPPAPKSPTGPAIERGSMMVSDLFSSSRRSGRHHHHHQPPVELIVLENKDEDAPKRHPQHSLVLEELLREKAKPSSSALQRIPPPPRDSPKHHPPPPPLRTVEEQLRDIVEPSSSVFPPERRRHSYPRNSPKGRHPKRTVQEGEKLRELLTAPPLIVLLPQTQAKSHKNPHRHYHHHHHPTQAVASSSDAPVISHLHAGMHHHSHRHRSPNPVSTEYYHRPDPPSITSPIMNKRKSLQEALQQRARELEAFDIVNKQSSVTTTTDAAPPPRAQKPTVVEVAQQEELEEPWWAQELGPWSMEPSWSMEEKELRAQELLEFDIVNKKSSSVAGPLPRRHSSPSMNNSTSPAQSHQKRTRDEEL